MTTKNQQKRLTQFHDEYRQAEQRMQMALQTLRGAQADVESKRLRFEAAVEFVGGTGATWTHNADDGVVVVEAAKPEHSAQNGAGPPTAALIAAKATRRQIKKDLTRG